MLSSMSIKTKQTHTHTKSTASAKTHWHSSTSLTFTHLQAVSHHLPVCAPCHLPEIRAFSSQANSKHCLGSQMPSDTAILWHWGRYVNNFPQPANADSKITWIHNLEIKFLWFPKQVRLELSRSRSPGRKRVWKQALRKHSREFACGAAGLDRRHPSAKNISIVLGLRGLCTCSQGSHQVECPTHQPTHTDGGWALCYQSSSCSSASLSALPSKQIMADSCSALSILGSLTVLVMITDINVYTDRRLALIVQR